MNRTGLIVVLAIAVIGGGIFALWPELDLALAAPFYNPAEPEFWWRFRPWVEWSREIVNGIITALGVLAGVAVLAGWVRPRWRFPVSLRAGLFMLTTLALGPGILANAVLKEHWGRPRPIDVVQFDGKDGFVPWWDPRGACPANCSFIGGEPSGAFWTLAPAALTPPAWRPYAYAAAVAFGVFTSVLRLVAGGHFVSDSLFAGVFMFLLVWFAHGVFFRWRWKWGGRDGAKSSS